MARWFITPTVLFFAYFFALRNLSSTPTRGDKWSFSYVFVTNYDAAMCRSNETISRYTRRWIWRFIFMIISPQIRRFHPLEVGAICWRSEAASTAEWFLKLTWIIWGNKFAARCCSGEQQCERMEEKFIEKSRWWRSSWLSENNEIGKLMLNNWTFKSQFFIWISSMAERALSPPSAPRCARSDLKNEKLPWR